MLHHITNVWAVRRAAPCSVLHTGEHSKSDSKDPSLRAGDRLPRSPLRAGSALPTQPALDDTDWQLANRWRIGRLYPLAMG